jgi:hypothetical protein
VYISGTNEDSRVLCHGIAAYRLYHIPSCLGLFEPYIYDNHIRTRALDDRLGFNCGKAADRPVALIGEDLI